MECLYLMWWYRNPSSLMSFEVYFILFFSNYTHYIKYIDNMALPPPEHKVNSSWSSDYYKIVLMTITSPLHLPLLSEIILCMHPANEMTPDSNVHGANMGPIWGPIGPRWDPSWLHELCYLGHYILTSSIIGWVHIQNNPRTFIG